MAVTTCRLASLATRVADELDVDLQLPDISEMPVAVRTMCIDNYRAALAGERGQFTFVS
jgi:hypothetical protein